MASEPWRKHDILQAHKALSFSGVRKESSWSQLISDQRPLVYESSILPKEKPDIKMYKKLHNA
jgi:hypothetical protein